MGCGMSTIETDETFSSPTKSQHQMTSIAAGQRPQPSAPTTSTASIPSPALPSTPTAAAHHAPMAPSTSMGSNSGNNNSAISAAAARKRFQERKQWIQARNNQIEAGLSLTHNRSIRTIKLLMLGAGESGKSTVIKQIRLIHGTGFTDRERAQYTGVIWSDAVHCMRTLITAARDLNIPLDSTDPESPLGEFNKLVMETDPAQQYDEDVTTGGQGSGVPSNGSSHNYLDDYVLKYDNRRHKKGKSPMGQQPSQQPQSTLNNTYNEINEHQGLLEDVEGEDLQSKKKERPPTKQEVATAISKLWKNDRGIRECFKRANQFQLEVNAEHYFENIFSYCQPGYMATDEDILKGRIKTTGINETNITIKHRAFQIIDVGGQRSERRKWIHCFDDVTAIIFVAAVSEYDEVLFEDATMNRMAEALLLFESICNSRWFSNTCIILFLNKIDKLQEKLPISPITKYFKNYTGNPLSASEACKYFENLFLAQNKNPRRTIYPYPTCATDTSSMKFVIGAVTKEVIHTALRDYGMI